MDRKRDQSVRPPEPLEGPENRSMPGAAGPPPGVDSENRWASAGGRHSDERHDDSIVPIQADDEWRRWIAENLLVGESIERIIEAMELRGFSSEEIALELKAAQDSPYLQGAALLCNRIKKREWLLAVYRRNHRIHPGAGGIERRHRLRRSEFLCDFYSTNRPVIITGMIDDWPAMRNWSLDYFVRTLGERQVEVRMPPNEGTNRNEQYVGKISFGDFVEKMRAGGENDDFELTAHFGSANRKALSPLWNEIGQIPEYLATDRPGGILNMAPRGTITPFRHDLANRLLVQVVGRTRLLIVPSWDIPFMYNNFHWFSRIDGRLVPTQPLPPLDEPQIHEVILDRGELLFLPIGWLQYVEAIEVSVTVSLTNFVFDNDFSSSYGTYGPV
jgi:Cupin-like domain